MNLYLRYFDFETLVSTADEAINFLQGIPDIKIDAKLEHDIREYAANDVSFPKRYKVRSHVYFIIIKTTAATMLDFKQKKALRSAEQVLDEQKATGEAAYSHYDDKIGWYEGVFDFKRVVTNPTNGKSEYRDTHFVARCKATSARHCYDRIVEYLRERVDSRSQFPSFKGKNFRFRYLGMWK